MKLENALWHYALQLYAEEGVEHACLQLQGAGLSINRLIYLIWLGLNGREYCPAAQEQAADWQQMVTHPLRAVRYRVRTVKQDSAAYDTCYQALRKAELACEQVELALLFEAGGQCVRAEPGAELVLENLARYLNGCTLESGADISSALKVVLGRALKHLPDNWAARLNFPGQA